MPYTDTQLLDILRDFYHQHGRSPRSKEVRLYSTIHRRFGTYRAALKAAGLEPASHASMRYSGQQLLDILRGFYKRHGRSPWTSEVTIYYSCRQQFGSFAAALKAAGLPPSPPRYYAYTDEQLIREARKLAAGINEFTPQCYDRLRPRHLPTSKYLIRRFKKWLNFLEKCGLKPEEKQYTAAQLLDGFRQIITNQEINLSATPDPDTPKFTREEFTKILLAACHQKGRRLKKKEIMLIEGMPGFSTLLRCFNVTGLKTLWEELGV